MRNLRSDFTKRQYMISEDFEIFYYSDVHFQNVQPHRHDYYEFYFPLSEQIEMEIGRKRVPLSRKSAVLIPPGILHRAIVSENAVYRRFVFWISEKYYRTLKESDPDITYIIDRCESRKEYLMSFSENEIAVLHAQILRLMEEVQSDRFGRQGLIDVSIRDLFLMMGRMAYEKDTSVPAAEGQLKMQDVLLYIDQHLEEDLSLEHLSGVFFVSRYYIAHLFKERLGISVHQYIIRKRLERCASAIATGRSVTKTFNEYGFRDYSAFFRSFKKEYGMSPKEYRELAEK